MPGLSNTKPVDMLRRFGFRNRIPLWYGQAERNMPGTLIGEQKIEIRQVVRLYLMPFDLGSTHQSKVCSRPVITMNKGGDIFVLGVNG